MAQDAKMKKMEEDQNQLASKLKDFEMTYKSRYLWLTKLLVAWTGIAALYYLLEVLNHIFGFYCH